MKINKTLRILTIITLLVVVAAFSGYIYVVKSSNTEVADDGIIIIPHNASFDDIVDTLKSKNYLKNAMTFRLVAKLKRYDKLYKVGKYKISDGLSNNALINYLRLGSQEPNYFTFNNLRTFDQLAGVVNKQLGIDSLEFMNVIQDTDYISNLGFNAETLPAMFIPNTYQIAWNTTAKELVQRMYKEYKKFWNESRTAKSQKLDLTPIQISIIASIVEEETNQRSEFGKVARVYINRYKRNWTLGACPTIRFAFNDYSIKRVLNKHLEIESPYNTYKYAGLPPGPIRMSSIQVIDEVLDSKPHDYMFFCAKADLSGTHNFSKTLAQHNRYAAEYHRALNERKIFK